ncbi:calmodulin-binding protein 25-like [Bidens hawaiensis]|uniref:calmodulin-binding protein 25-like n=1 Tax=Bidens hawaiensis TaxID=980011 RepID=UPI00404A93B3
MASYDNLTAVDPWMFRSSIADPWFPANDFAVETESALTKALQQSLFSQPIVAAPGWPKQSDYSASASASTVTGSGAGFGSGSGSEPETPGSKHRGGSGNNSLLGVSIGKSKKRKSRASKRMTTYIQAEPSNFRQMVQEVTGVKFEGSGRLPEPERLRRPVFNEMQGLLPTLDTSAYLIDNARRFPVSGSAMGVSKRSQVTENGGGAGVIDVYSCFSFPTLESSI